MGPQIMVIGKQLDASWLRPQPGSTLDVVLGHAVRRHRRTGQDLRARHAGRCGRGLGRRSTTSFGHRRPLALPAP